jgi:hypothetical protein
MPENENENENENEKIIYTIMIIKSFYDCFVNI